MTQHLLDNPIWSALNSIHLPLARSAGSALRYPREIAPFLGLPDGSVAVAEDLEALIDDGEQVFLLGTAPLVPAGWTIEPLGLLLQMHCLAAPERTKGPAITPLIDPRQRMDVRQLTALVYPHYFRTETMRLGRYFGIYEHGHLAAMVGERMGMPGHREVSAVCTHPEFTGRGFARHLLASLTLELLEQGQQPFLHVSPQNRRAVDLYEQNGYRIRTEIPFHALQRTSANRPY
ncbi:MAG: GNAT family N-acetyltransferase [Ahniella sp.]|nr:GNAT family N-acetyltransferase [Ahniella sp.]